MAGEHVNHTNPIDPKRQFGPQVIVGPNDSGRGNPGFQPDASVVAAIPENGAAAGGTGAPGETEAANHLKPGLAVAEHNGDGGKEDTTPGEGGQIPTEPANETPKGLGVVTPTDAEPFPGARGNRVRRMVIGFAIGCAAGTALFLFFKGHGDPNAVISALPTPSPELIPDPPVTVPPVGSTAFEFSEAAKTTSDGEGWLHVIGEVVPGITSVQAHDLLDKVSPALLEIRSNTGEAIAYTGAPGGIGINKSDGSMPVEALKLIHGEAVKAGLA